MAKPSPMLDIFTSQTFGFTINLLESLGVEIPHHKLFVRLNEVANGDVTLYDSAEEVILRRERENGGPITALEKQAIRRSLEENRPRTDWEDQEIAKRLVRAYKALADRHGLPYGPLADDPESGESSDEPPIAG